MPPSASRLILQFLREQGAFASQKAVTAGRVTCPSAPQEGHWPEGDTPALPASPQLAECVRFHPQRMDIKSQLK